MTKPDRYVLKPNDLFKLRYVHDARIAPDGQSIAYVTSRTSEELAEEFFEITIEDLASGTRNVIDYPGKATFPRWSPDGKSLIFIGTESETSRLYLFDSNGGGVTPVTPDGQYVQGAPAWSPDGSSIAYTTIHKPQENGCVHRITKRIFKSEGLGYIDNVSWHLHIANIAQRKSRRIELGGMFVAQPAYSPCGKHLLFLGADAGVGYASFNGLKLYRMELSGGRPTQLLDDHWFVSSAAWSPCGKRIVFAGDYRSGLPVPMARLWVVNADGTNPQCRSKNSIGNLGLRIHHDMPTWGTSQNNILTVPDSSHAYVTMVKRGCAEISRISLDGPESCEAVAAGPRTCVTMDANTATGQLLYCASNMHMPWELYLSDPAGEAERRITQLNDDVLAQWPALKFQHLEYESKDGVPLEGWHLQRADRQGPQPTIMFVHGGPMLAVGHVFRFDFHLLAANGYAVLFANFRGSCGYGEPFMHAIGGDFGARGYPDHMATVDTAISLELADPDRLGVWGASHGGFATCWIVGHTHRFKAAVAEASLTNFSTHYYLCDWADLFADDLGGRPDEIPDIYRSRSPLTYAWRCRTPTLMLHGEDDLRCPITEAEQFYRALHDAGCTTEMVRISGMDHMGDCIGPLPVRLAQNEVLLDWFERFL